MKKRLIDVLREEAAKATGRNSVIENELKNNWNEIKEAIDAGFSLKAIWQAMKNSGSFSGSYGSFLNYISAQEKKENNQLLNDVLSSPDELVSTVLKDKGNQQKVSDFLKWLKRTVETAAKASKKNPPMLMLCVVFAPGVVIGANLTSVEFWLDVERLDRLGLDYVALSYITVIVLATIIVLVGQWLRRNAKKWICSIRRIFRKRTTADGN